MFTPQGIFPKEMDWFEGNFYGKFPILHGKNQWFPVETAKGLQYSLAALRFQREKKKTFCNTGPN
jgi:hypothetical protein